MIDFTQTISDYFSQGFQVVPCNISEGALGKKEIKFFCSWMSELTENKIIATYKKNRRKINGLCLKTGQTAGRDGLTVLDCDNSNAADLISPLCYGVPKVKTPRGVHYYFSYAPNLKTSSYQDLRIDVRSNHGLVVIPPSNWNGNNYSWITPIDGELKPCSEDLIAIFFSKPQKELCTTTSTEKSFFKQKNYGQLSRKQKDIIQKLIILSDTAERGHRSEKDFYLVLFLHRAGLSQQSIYDLVNSYGKFHENGKQYFDITYKNVLSSLT